MIAELFSRVRFWSSCDRIGPDIPLTHWRLYYPKLMRALCQRKFASFGNSSEFRPGAYAITCSKIAIGARVVIRPQTMLFADPRLSVAGRILIEDDVLIGSGVHIYTANHDFSDPDKLIAMQGHSAAQDVVVRNGAWIGANTIILSGVEIGSGAVIGAGSVVSRSIPEGSIAIGNHARVVRNRHDGERVSSARVSQCTCGQSGHSNRHEPGCPLSDYQPVK